jgi:hypothetical protein
VECETHQSDTVDGIQLEIEDQELPLEVAEAKANKDLEEMKVMNTEVTMAHANAGGRSSLSVAYQGGSKERRHRCGADRAQAVGASRAAVPRV